MQEEITLLIQMALAILGGTAAIGILIVRKKVQKEPTLIFSWILYVFFVFWMFNVLRCLLLCSDRILAYSEDKYLLPVDFFVTAGVVAFVCYTRDAKEDSKVAFKVILCAILLLYYMVCFIRYRIQYANFNAAVYYSFLPGRTACLGLVILIGWLLCEKVRLLYGGQKAKTERKRKYWMEISVVSLVIVTFYLCPTFETLLTNMEEFSFSLGTVWYRFIFWGIVEGGLGLGFLLLLNEKRRKIFLAVAWSASIGAYLQGMFFNNRLFLMDGKQMEWSDQLKLSNLLVWCVIGMVLTGVCLWLKTSGGKLMMAVSGTLCLMQMIGVLSLLPSYIAERSQEAEVWQNYLSTQGLYEVASEDNVIIIVLDTFDVDYMEKILEQDPNFLAPLKGFVYFPDMVSQFPRTFPSVPYMLTGEEYFYEMPKWEYVNNAFSQCTFWSQLRENGYGYYIFEYERDIIGGTVLKSAANFVEEGTVIDKETSIMGCAETMFRIGNYRLFPYFLKGYYTYTSENINRLVNEKRVFDIPEYENDDVQHWQGLKRYGLKVSEESKALRFIHMNGAHAPYDMDETGKRVHEDDSCIPQCKGSMNFVYDYLACLQEVGAYEQSTIIITADHGENYMLKQLEQTTNPILFIKPHGVGADKELQISDVYASQNDLLPTICAILGMQYDRDWGMNLLDTQGLDKERVRYYYYTLFENTEATKARTYKIKGSSLNFDNWEATDEYYEFGEY